MLSELQVALKDANRLPAQPCVTKVREGLTLSNLDDHDWILVRAVLDVASLWLTQTGCSCLHASINE